MTGDPVVYIQNLDLQYLVLRLVDKMKWDLVDAQDAVRKYKNFLILKCIHPDFNCVPTPEIDEVWHSHILFTLRYTHDCNQIFGEYLHHHPFTGNAEERVLLDDGYVKAMRLYESTFHESYGYALDVSRWQ